MSSKNNRRDHVARVQPKSDPNSRPDNPAEQSPIIPISSSPLTNQMSEDRLSWIDGLKAAETPISNASQPAPPPEHKTPASSPPSPPVHNTYIAPKPLAPSPESEIDKIISPAPLSRKKSVWDEHVPPFILEPSEQSPSSLLSPESIIVSTAPPSPPKNVPNLPPEMEWLVEYADTRNAIKLDRDES